MVAVAKVFMNGRSQAVRLPAEFRFDCSEVFVRRDPVSGDVILSTREPGWGDLLAMVREHGAPEDFLDERERAVGDQERDPLAGLS